MERLWKILFMLVMFSSYSLSDDNVYIVGVENIDHYPHYALKNGNWAGFGRELLDAFSEKYDYTFIYSPYPVKRLMQDNMEGKVNLRFPDNPLWSSSQREGVDVRYSDTFIEVIEGTMVRPENKGLGLESIKTLGTIIGFTAASYLESIEQGGVVVDTSSDSVQLIKKTMMKRLDGSYLSVDSARHLLATVINQPEGLVFDPSLPYDKYAYLLSTTTHPELIETFNQFLVDEAALVKGLVDKYEIFVMDDTP